MDHKLTISRMSFSLSDVDWESGKKYFWRCNGGIWNFSDETTFYAVHRWAI